MNVLLTLGLVIGMEWMCESIPPQKTLWEIVSYDEDLETAKKLGLNFCNKMFKTDKCKIKFCKLIKK